MPLKPFQKTSNDQESDGGLQEKMAATTIAKLVITTIAMIPRTIRWNSLCEEAT
jgi:hypothetical protein